jgi:hypothetical protein
MAKNSKSVSWKEQVEGWKRSGLSGVEYGRQHGVSAGVLYAWKHRLKAQAKAERSKETGVQFVPVQVVGGSVEPEVCSLEVVLSNGRIVRVRGRVDSEALEQALRATEALGR